MCSLWAVLLSWTQILPSYATMYQYYGQYFSTVNELEIDESISLNSMSKYFQDEGIWDKIEDLMVHNENNQISTVKLKCMNDGNHDLCLCLKEDDSIYQCSSYTNYASAKEKVYSENYYNYYNYYDMMDEEESIRLVNYKQIQIEKEGSWGFLSGVAKIMIHGSWDNLPEMNQQCSGALISKDGYLLTALHCLETQIYGHDGGGPYVYDLETVDADKPRIFAHFRKPVGSKANKQEWISCQGVWYKFHQKFHSLKGDERYDIAVIKLKLDDKCDLKELHVFDLGDFNKYLPLNDEGKKKYKVYTAGWGKNTILNVKEFDYLPTNKKNIEALKLEKHEQSWVKPQLHGEQANGLAFGTAKTTPGDSGGPLILVDISSEKKAAPKIIGITGGYQGEQMEINTNHKLAQIEDYVLKLSSWSDREKDDNPLSWIQVWENEEPISMQEKTTTVVFGHYPGKSNDCSDPNIKVILLTYLVEQWAKTKKSYDVMGKTVIDWMKRQKLTNLLFCKHYIYYRKPPMERFMRHVKKVYELKYPDNVWTWESPMKDLYTYIKTALT